MGRYHNSTHCKLSPCLGGNNSITLTRWAVNFLIEFSMLCPVILSEKIICFGDFNGTVQIYTWIYVQYTRFMVRGYFKMVDYLFNRG